MQDPAESGETRRETTATSLDPIGGGGTASADDDSAGRTRREDVPVAGAESLLTLPPELAVRFAIVAELDAAGAEADMLRVRDQAGEELVLKLYRRGITPNREMWETLRGVRSPHIVRLRDTGQAGGRAFEVMEYLPHGTLRDLANEGGAASPEVITEVVRQVADGLTVLHEHRVIHRDLKPENILLRFRDPLRLALADFGLSRYVKQTAMFSSAGHTLAYSAPETFAGFVSVMRDWWSLGMIVRELALGEPPFADLVPEAVMLHLASRPIDVSGVEDERLRLLCRGLLVRDPDDRWGGGEVAEWLAGGSPPVHESVDSPLTTAEVKPFLFGEQLYTDRAELAAAMAERWDETAERYFARGGAARETLKTWLRQFDDPRIHDVQARDELLDRMEGLLPADVRLLMLLRWLNPGMPPIYAGGAITAANLGALAAAALDPAAGQHRRSQRVVDDLTEHNVLSTLAQCPGGEDLGEVKARLDDATRRWQEITARARERRPELGTSRTADVKAELLLIALDADEAKARLAEQIPAGRESLPVPVPWFDELAREAGDDAAGLLVVRQALPAAAAEAGRIHRELTARQRQEQERMMRWQQREADRLGGRVAAVAVAVAGCVLMAVVWAGFLLLSVFSGSSDIATVVAAGVLICQAATEITLAVTMGAMYHPRYSLLQKVGVLGGRAGDAVSDTGGCVGCLIVVLSAAVLSVLTKVFPPMVPLVVTAVYGAWTYRRWSGWTRWHEDEKRKALEG
ncbi:serine/threonine-protein kinase [Actinomadura soli]|uniref:Serine/threonine-protein kinase n=1 Tax=Actinomadura soli TaxID=2508997 RepID=A0A5C4JEX3_9ACTN|nr:protein kinase [Actinomadura soli]TMR03698.1 serine/threonine-protein kinase [Actinomadura soli]